MKLPIEGRIDIHLYPQPGGAFRVEINSSRPLQVVSLLQGKSPAQVLATIPRLYAICGVAQSRAALAAIQQASALPVSTALDAAREILLLLETAREHSIRISVDWPRLFEIPAERDALTAARERVGAFSRAMFGDSSAFALDSRFDPDIAALETMIDELESELQRGFYSVALPQWLGMRHRDALTHWIQAGDGIAARALANAFDRDWQNQGAADCVHLPVTGSLELLQRFDSADSERFIVAPDWQGRPCETSALTRQRKHPLVKVLNRACGNALITRWIARLVELADIPRRLRDLLGSLDSGDEQPAGGPGIPDGVAQVEAVRGRLIHRVRVEGEVITRVQVLAPTEWNFHPRGLLCKSLEGLRPAAPAQLETLARLVIDAIDPCVGYRLRIH